MDRTWQEDGDRLGLETLENFAGATEYNKWLFGRIVNFCEGSVLEIGSGIGNISRYLLDLGVPVTLTDLREEYCSRLAGEFSGERNLASIHRLDLSRPDFDEQYRELIGQYDSVIALNVVEHIQDDGLAVRNCKKLLKSGGRLVVLVPAYGWLYNSLDRGLGHFRRYTARSLQRLMGNQGLKIIHTSYFDCPAIPGWWFSGSVLKKKIVPQGQLKIFNSLVPFFRLVDRVVGHAVGISVIVVGKPV